MSEFKLNRRKFLMGAATTTAYFFAPVGGWSSPWIINPNARPVSRPVAPVGGSQVHGKYNYIVWDKNAVYNCECDFPMPKNYNFYKRKMSTRPELVWTDGGKPGGYRFGGLNP